jgi:tetrahydromethanopterin S-methyltransferase subunit G
MLNMRESWTDERLDDFAKHVDHRFDEVDRRFDEVDRRFGEVDRRFDKVDAELHRVNDRLDGIQRALIFAIIAMTTMTFAGYAALGALIATQL